MKKPFKYLLYPILVTLLFIGLYFLTAYIFTFFPKSTNQKTKKTKTVYLLYSSIHSDIVFNIKDINLTTFPEFKNKKHGYISFGWGDKETYLNTPRIDDIKLSTTLKALFINTPSLMHVSYFPHIKIYKSIKTIKLSTTQKKHLKASILRSFSSNKKRYKGYEDEDFFYEAKGKYNLVNTCNTWTGTQLRESNVSMPYWTPLVSSLINTLP